MVESQVDLSDKKYAAKDYCFAEWLTRVKKLAVIPPSVFYSAESKHLGENFIRLCFIKVNYLKKLGFIPFNHIFSIQKEDEKLMKAKEILQEWNKSMA